VELRLANIQGDLAIVDSKLELYERNHGGNGESPQLEISNKIVFGGSAVQRLQDGTSGLASVSGGALGEEVKSDIYFGSDRLGQLVIPNGSIRTTIGLLPQE
jgi:hypothetical protein